MLGIAWFKFSTSGSCYRFADFFYKQAVIGRWLPFSLVFGDGK